MKMFGWMKSGRQARRQEPSHRPTRQRARHICLIISLALSFLLADVGHAYVPSPGGTNSSPSYTPLDYWPFNDTTNWTSGLGYAPVSFTNIASTWLGNGTSLFIDSTNPAWLQYNVFENDGTTNLTVDQGSVTFWFAPYWSSTNDAGGGLGPQEWGRLLEVGGYTPDSSYGWWSIYVDPAGANIYFSAQTNDNSGNAYTISMPIDFTTNYWHFITLTYSSTNVSLYLDGQLETNDTGGLNVWPGSDVLSNGFFVGSDSNGIYQAQGMIDDLYTYNVPLDAGTIGGYFIFDGFDYWMNPRNAAAMFKISSGQTQTTQYTPFNDVITGPGNLQLVGSASTCSNGTNAYNVWITNVVTATAGNGTMNLEFTIEGGSNGVPFDVFANSVLSFGTNGIPWAWEGQGYQCNTYMLTNLPNGTCFLILGTPQDTDGDGLTDAYELLVSKSSPTNYSTDGTGMADGWEVLYFGHTGIDPNGDPDKDGLSNYQEYQMYSEGYNPVKWDSDTNSVVGDGYQDYSGDGLANLLEASFGGNMLTNNLTWKVNTSGDGLPDEYKTMVGLSTNSVVPAPGLPAYSKNPIP